jgi:hypothetical protein
VVQLRKDRIGVGYTHGGRLFMFTSCCTVLKVAEVMVWEAVSWSPVSIHVYDPT